MRVKRLEKVNLVAQLEQDTGKTILLFKWFSPHQYIPAQETRKGVHWGISAVIPRAEQHLWLQWSFQHTYRGLCCPESPWPEFTIVSSPKVLTSDRSKFPPTRDKPSKFCWAKWTKMDHWSMDLSTSFVAQNATPQDFTMSRYSLHLCSCTNDLPLGRHSWASPCQRV